MLGFEGVAVPLGLILTLLSAALCIGYGLKNWNKGYITEEEIEQEKIWKQEAANVEEVL